MKNGQLFRIPECPGDVDRLRAEAVPLDRFTHPTWLDTTDRDCYRYLGTRSSESLTNGEREQFLAEIEQLEMAGLVLDVDGRDRHLRHLYVQTRADYPTWSIGIYTGQSPYELHPPSAPTNPVLTRDDVSDVPAALVADPFMVREESGWFMFFEVLNWSTNKGEIALATSSDGLHWSYEEVVLSESFHVSYPYVFEVDGEYYMIPESRQCAEVRLYRAVDFPHKWSFHATLLQGELIDPSLFFHRGRYWMLAGLGNGRHDILRLFWANSLTGNWVEHQKSPIVLGNAQIARPAGRVLVWNERILRFAQNCEGAYGEDVRVLEITELSKTNYSEKQIGRKPILGPSGDGWNASGMHHVDAHLLSGGSWLACVDGWTERLPLVTNPT